MSKRQTLYSDIFDVEMIEYYQEHIIEFVYDIIFQNNPEYFLSDQQKELLVSIQNNKRVAAKSGKGIGKTGSLSFAIIWFLTCFENPKVICTAPAYPTLKSGLWPEINLWLSRSLVKDIYTHTSDRLYLTENPKNWWAEPRTAKEKENIQGLHQENMLILIDEASGMDQEIFEALDTTLTGKNNKIVMIGNPTQVVGPFYDAFNKFSKRWRSHTFNAELSPFVKADQIEYYAEKYGKHHDLYLVNVLGEFPSGSPEAFMKLGDIQKAVNRDITAQGEIEIGVDVARFGDDLTCIYWRHGFKVYPAKTLGKSSIPEVVELVLNIVKEIRSTTGSMKKIRIKIDDSGVGGGVVDYLKLDRENNIEVVPCNFGGKGNEEYQNEASIMWGRVRDVLPFISLPDDSHLIEEMSARRWRMSPTGKIMIEPKSEFKKDFKASPDRADALVLCFATKIPEQIVLKTFDALDTEIIKDKLNYSGEEKYASVFYSKDLNVSIVYCAWDGSRMYVYDEYAGSDPLIHIATDLRSHQPLTRIFGNSYMFDKSGDDLATKFMKFKINVWENYRYNELASIEALSVMVTQKRVVINKRCNKLIEQMQTWKIEGTKNTLERDFGLCYALSMITSELKRKLDNRVQSNVFVPYSGEKEKSIKEFNIKKCNSWMSM